MSQLTFSSCFMSCFFALRWYDQLPIDGGQRQHLVSSSLFNLVAFSPTNFKHYKI